MTDKWNPITLKAEVADVKRCLGSVMRMCEAGNVVHFEKDNSYIMSVASGRKTYMRENGKGYAVDMWVPDTGAASSASSPSFSGQGKP